MLLFGRCSCGIKIDEVRTVHLLAAAYASWLFQKLSPRDGFRDSIIATGLCNEWKNRSSNGRRAASGHAFWKLTYISGIVGRIDSRSSLLRSLILSTKYATNTGPVT